MIVASVFFFFFFFVFFLWYITTEGSGFMSQSCHTKGIKMVLVVPDC